MKINEAISNVKNDFRLVHADRRITLKYIYTLLQKHTAALIKQESDKNVLVKSDTIWQSLNCIELIEVPTTDECCKYTSKCKIYRTKDKLPEMYEDSWGVIFRSINSIDMSKDITVIKMSQWLRKLENANFKYDKTFYVFYRNGYLYFPNIKWKLITITGYFKEDITKYNTCEEDVNKCLPIPEQEWRVPQYLQSRVIDFTIRELLQTFAQANPDQEVQINKIPSQ